VIEAVISTASFDHGKASAVDPCANLSGNWTLNDIRNGKQIIAAFDQGQRKMKGRQCVSPIDSDVTKEKQHRRVTSWRHWRPNVSTSRRFILFLIQISIDRI